jgi:hypothetical protein
MKEVTCVNDVMQILDHTVAIANHAIETGSLVYVDGSTNEKSLFELIQIASENEGFRKASAELISGHKFPDVIFASAQVGVEIKGHKQGDRILGNSIMGSTLSLSSPIAIYLLAWNESEKKVIWRDYFECVVGAEVTHSPRFVLEPGCTPEESLFGSGENQIGDAQEICLGSSGFRSDVILARMRARALADGNLPWWISPIAQESANSSELAQNQLSIVKYSQLAADSERLSFLKTLLIGFPVLLGRSQTKYDEALVWSLLRKSVLISRDAFSAGGRHEVLIPTICEERVIVLPQVLKRAKELFTSNAVVKRIDVEEIWHETIASNRKFIKQLSQRIVSSGISSHFATVKHENCSCYKLDEVIFAEKITDWLLEGFASSSIT